ncbi:MAG TPA: NUDIX hydrolase [Candidatus Saccharimonadales bacterium]|nr:NUDIX hydrolase [Candidatus Saccharimonadales bacterium]
MKLDFAWKDDGQIHSYCIVCHGERVEKRAVDGLTKFYCADCDKLYDRRIEINPATKTWIADDGTWWHDVSSIFVRSPDGKFLFFELTKFPYGVTVPAGHIDSHEEPLQAAVRELQEEVGLTGKPVLAAEDALARESCSRGCDSHVWHSFVVQLDDTPSVTLNDEGMKPVWLTLDEALDRDLTVPTRFVIEHHKDELLA